MRGLLDTSVVIEIFDRGNTVLLENIMDKYSALYIPWIVLYEYLYGHKYLGRDITSRKKAIEKLGEIIGVSQEILLKALEIDVELHRKGQTIPFTDLLIVATTLVLNAELITIDQKHYTRIPNLKIYVPSITREQR